MFQYFGAAKFVHFHVLEKIVNLKKKTFEKEIEKNNHIVNKKTKKFLNFSYLRNLNV